MLDERVGRFVPWQGARKPGGRLAERCEMSVPLICCLRMDGRSTWFPRPSFAIAARRCSRLREMTCAASMIAEVARACARSRTPRPVYLCHHAASARLGGSGLTRRIWIYLWRHMSLSCCPTLATDPIFGLRAVRRPHVVVFLP